MALTPERYAEIDAELQRMRDYLAALASFPDGALHSSAVSTLGAISILRHALAQSKEHESMGDEIQRRLYGGK